MIYCRSQYALTDSTNTVDLYTRRIYTPAAFILTSREAIIISNTTILYDSNFTMKKNDIPHANQIHHFFIIIRAAGTTLNSDYYCNKLLIYCDIAVIDDKLMLFSLTLVWRLQYQYSFNAKGFTFLCTSCAHINQESLRSVL